MNLDIQKLMCKPSDEQENKPDLNNAETNLSVDLIRKKLLESKPFEKKSPVTIAGFRIIDLSPNENESLGFDVCLGPTGTFIMVIFKVIYYHFKLIILIFKNKQISYVEPER